MTERDNMLLPEGKTCADCIHFYRCEQLISCEPTNTRCDWAPSRFGRNYPKEIAAKDARIAELTVCLDDASAHADSFLRSCREQRVTIAAKDARIAELDRILKTLPTRYRVAEQDKEIAALKTRLEEILAHSEAITEILNDAAAGIAIEYTAEWRDKARRAVAALEPKS